MRVKDIQGWLGNIESIYKEFVTVSGNTVVSYTIADDVVITKALNKLHEGIFITQAPDIKE